MYSAWPILGTEMISIPKHRDSILLILDTDTIELRYLLNPFNTVDYCEHAKPFLGQMGILWSASIEMIAFPASIGSIAQLVSKQRESKASTAILSILEVWAKH